MGGAEDGTAGAGEPAPPVEARRSSRKRRPAAPAAALEAAAALGAAAARGSGGPAGRNRRAPPRSHRLRQGRADTEKWTRGASSPLVKFVNNHSASALGEVVLGIGGPGVFHLPHDRLAQRW